MYKSPHSLTAKNRLFWKRRKKKKNKERKKKTELTNVCAWQGADVLGFSLAFVFKRQSTVKTKQNGHVVSFVSLFVSFPVLLYCDKKCEFWSHKLLKGNGSAERDGQMDGHKAQNRRRSKVTATETASRMNSVYKWVGPCGIRILSQNKACPL